jgi:hypothetical protein
MLQHRQGQQEGPLSGDFALGLTQALGNYVSIVNASVADTSAPANNYIIAAIVLKPKVTGIFRVNVDLGWFDQSTGDDVEISLITAEAAVPADPILLGNGVNGAFFGSQVDPTSLGQFAITPGTSMTITNAGPTTPLASNTVLSEAGIGQQQGFDINGIFSNSNGIGKAPFTIGVDCVFYIQINTDAGAITNMKLQFTVQEEPVV